MKLQIYKNPDDKTTKIWYIEIKNELTEKWYNEMMNRFKKSEWERFDIDETFEIWKISVNHLIEMLNFLKKNK